VDEYLSEKEQIERLREWWRDNGWYLAGGVVLGAILLFGWNQYKSYEERHATAASSLYQQLDDAVQSKSETQAQTLLSELRDKYPSSPYAAQGALLVARLELLGSPDKAVEELRFVMENSSDADLALVARLRLARVFTYRKEYQQALQVLVVDDPGAFSARFSEVKGDIYAALGQTEAARTAYTQALNAPAGELVDRNFIQMKLDDLPQMSQQDRPPAAEEGA
jgi:predicted negative regulator of RcsB-dependent stress response